MIEEKSYPVYSINAKWSQPGIQDQSRPNWHKDLGPGRIWNGTGTTISFKEEKSEDEVKLYFDDWWKMVVKNLCHKDNFKEEDVQNIELTIKFNGNQTWWIKWFSHMSFNRFENEKDAFGSFSKFLESKNVQMNYYQGDVFSSGHIDDPKDYCSMGANDEWRWKYCDCNECKKNEVTVITH